VARHLSLRAGQLRDPADRARHARLDAWWAEEAAPALAPLAGLFAAADAAPSLAGLMQALRDSGEALAGDAMWQGQDGRALAGVVAELTAAPDAARFAVPPEAAVRVLTALLDTVTVRPPWRQHPRLAIWGPLEARLQSADLMILGGMNEGQWPAEPGIDPWLAPAIAKALGLPAAQTRIGLMAHDLMGGLSAREILFTRAERDEAGAATIPSRFLLRMEAAIGALPRDAELESALAVDGGAAPVRATRPAPAPPPAARPPRLSVTDADLLAADPFGFYAKRILLLRDLDPLEQDPDAAMRGIAVHRIAEQFAQQPTQDPVPLIDAALSGLGAGPALRLLWRPRLLRMTDWLRDQLARDAADGWTVAAVEAGADATRHGIRLVGKADRIDRHHDGRYRIIDYKTGSPPAKKAFEAGHARQLPMLRMLLEQGAMAAAPAGGEVAQLLYVKLSGGGRPATIKGASWQLDRAALEADLDSIIARWLTGTAPFLAKQNPVFAMQYRSYDHLARLEEWIGHG
jgi:ATP-dependent helicase/nuclease subunit B